MINARRRKLRVRENSDVFMVVAGCSAGQFDGRLVQARAPSSEWHCIFYQFSPNSNSKLIVADCSGCVQSVHLCFYKTAGLFLQEHFLDERINPLRRLVHWSYRFCTTQESDATNALPN